MLIVEVIIRALAVCRVKTVCGSVEETWYESPGTQRAWEFNSALGNVAVTPAFGLGVKKPGVEDAMLQFCAGRYGAQYG